MQPLYGLRILDSVIHPPPHVFTQALRQDGGTRCITETTADQSIACASAREAPNQR